MLHRSHLVSSPHPFLSSPSPSYLFRPCIPLPLLLKQLLKHGTLKINNTDCIYCDMGKKKIGLYITSNKKVQGCNMRHWVRKHCKALGKCDHPPYPCISSNGFASARVLSWEASAILQRGDTVSGGVSTPWQGEWEKKLDVSSATLIICGLTKTFPCNPSLCVSCVRKR